MALTYKFLDWDSNIFGYKIGSINTNEANDGEFQEVIKNVKNCGVKLLYIFSNPEDNISNKTILKTGARIVDQKVILEKCILQSDLKEADTNIKPYHKLYPTKDLINLALQSGIYSRFKLDAKFINNEYEKLYLEWIERSVKKEIANEVFVFSIKNLEMGFITLSLENSVGEIGLIAVDEKSRGKFIGTKLLQKAFGYFNENKINKVMVATQLSNTPAVNFYKANKFNIAKITNVYHLWF